jgi:glycosyltransferase involved in cell wall biosynthesis
VNPTVSVVIPTFNYARFLPETLDSAIEQTFTDIEIIVVDDGSTDATPEVIQPYLADRRVRYHRGDHRGTSAARNIGIRLARAPLVAFLDSDDIWLPEKLQRQVPLFERDPQVAVVYSRRLSIDEHGRPLPLGERPLHRGQVLGALFRQNFICFSSGVVRRSALEAVGMCDEGIDLSIDFDLWLRLAARYRLDYVDEPLVKYRTGHPSLSTRRLERLHVARFVMDRFLNEYGGRQLLSRSAIRLGMAELCCDLAWETRDQRLQACRWYATALRHRLFHVPAWRGLLTCWWPEAAKQLARRVRNMAPPGKPVVQRSE